MDQTNTFSYKYSAKENKEIQEIRKKYLPQSESKLDELKRLDGYVQSSGIVEGLCAGIGGFCVFGLGMCCVLQVIGSSVWMTVLGVLLTIIGLIGMIVAYPVYRSFFDKTKAKYAPRIIELSEELSSER